MASEWKWDQDGWLWRWARRDETDAALFPDQTMGFVLGGKVYTRSRAMAEKVDAGQPVTLADAA